MKVMKFKSPIYFNCRQATKDQGITGQTQDGSGPKHRACSHTLIRTWINKFLAENRKGKQALVIPLTEEDEMIIEEPTPAIQGETEEIKLFPKVSYIDVDKCLLMKESYIAQVETKKQLSLLIK